MKKTIWWTDHLRLKEFLLICRESARHHNKISGIRYFGMASFWGRFLSQVIFFKGKSSGIQKAKFDTAIPVESGEFLYWHLYRDFMRFGWEAGRETEKDHAVWEELCREYNQETIKLSYPLAIGWEQYRNISLIRLVEHYTSGLSADFQSALLIDGKVWEAPLRKYSSKYQPRVHFYFKRNYYVWIFLRILNLAFKSFRHFLRAAWKKSALLDSSGSKGKVAVFYAHGVDLNKRSDLFWFPQSGIDPQDVVVYFLDSTKPPTKENMKVIDDLGLRHFSFLSPGLHPDVALSQKDGRYDRLFSQKSYAALKALLRSLKNIFIRPNPVKLWQYERLVWLLDRTAHFEAFFIAENIKVHFGLFSENDQNLFAVNLAMDRINGADVYAHWSNHFIEQIMPAHDVYFSWGPYYRPFYEKFGHGIKNLIYCGYPFVNVNLSVKSRSLRQGLESAGAKFVLSFFDNFYVEGLYFSKENLVQFQKMLLQKVQEHKDWGIILKPKRDSSLQQVWGELSHLIEQLQREGRCAVLKNRELPSEAALASDLVIGYGICSTPVIESALLDVPIITYDPGCQYYHPFYKQGFGKIVFNDMDSLISRIEKYSVDHQQNDGFADFSHIRSQIDPFNDQKAHSRIGKYIHVLLEELSEGRDKTTAIKNANAVYQQEYGEGMVVDFKDQALAPKLEKITV